MSPPRKRKAITNEEWIISDNYCRKLRKRPPPPPLKLSNKEKKQYTFKSPYLQQYPFHKNLIYYICKNPSFGDGHLKLISSCKALFLESQTIPVKKLKYKGDNSDGREIWKPNDVFGASINLKNQIFKLWIYDEISVFSNSTKSNVASSLVKHIYHFSLRELTLYEQILTFEELQILCSGGNLKRNYFHENIVKNADGSIVEFEKVFEVICCKETYIVLPNNQHGVGSNTANKIIKILGSEHTPKESKIILDKIPESFDCQVFSAFLKKNMEDRKHTFDLCFALSISDTYKNQLTNFVNEIVELRGIFAHTVPIIAFRGQNHEAFIKLHAMRYDPVEGILTNSKIS